MSAGGAGHARGAAVPLVDLVPQQAEVHAEVMAGLEELLLSGAFIGGEPVAAFEREYARFIGVGQCVGTSNGTDALELGLRALGLRAGDEVILPTNTFVATAEAVHRAGGVPVPVDVDPEYLLIDPEAVAAAITPRTRVVIPVHLHGQSAFVERVEEAIDGRGIAVLEDAAQAQGARRNGRAAGSLGRLAATSFYPGKNLGAAGDAGAVLSDDEELAATVRRLGNHGAGADREHLEAGCTARLDAVQALVLRAKLARLPAWNAARTAAAARYSELLLDLPGVRAPHSAPGNDDVWHVYAVRVPHRDEVLRRLQAQGIGASVHYPVPVHLTPAFSHLGLARGSRPVAEEAAERLLSLPLHPHLDAATQERVVDALSVALRGVGAS